MDWIEKIFNKPATVLTIMVSSGAVGFIVGIANGVIQKRHGGWAAFFASVLSGSIVAAIVGLALSEYVKSLALQYAVVGFCAVVSDDIWAGFKTLGQMFRNNPIEMFFRVLDALRGRAPTQPSPPKE